MQGSSPAQTSESFFEAKISHKIWDDKYRFREPATKNEAGETVPGKIHDLTVEDSWHRIAGALVKAEDEDKRPAYEKQFFEALTDFRFLPAGRITAGAGTGRSVTLFNCFVMGTIPDTMAGIFDMLKEAALTMQQGGGIGYDFSTLRPKGSLVKGVGSDASGPLSFMNVWSSMCETIMSAGSRRGAMMATMRCDHPDIEDFITAKQDATRLRMFNLSVLVTDAFMQAVDEDTDWDLVWNGETHKTVRARDIWDKIMRSTYEFAEPGVIFIDRINKRNNLNYVEEIAATNPCGEQPLPPYGACLLGSVNLARLIKNPFQDTACINVRALKELISTAIRMMDNVVDVSRFPLPQQEEEAKNKRRIGLGVTGLADALLMMRMRYGSDEAADQTEAWMRLIQNTAYRASVELAKEKGAFPLFDRDLYMESVTVKDLDQDVQDDIARYGIRNALLTSIAPTGTISLYAGNVSSGVEPVFAWSYNRKVLKPDGTHYTEEVVDYAVKIYRDKWAAGEFSKDGKTPPEEPWSNDLLPDYFVSAQTLDPLEHVKMQAAAQQWVDSSISKTINCPEDISFEEFKEVYTQAYAMGCKGCTTYRPNEITGSVLSVAEDSAPAAPAQPPVEQGTPIPRSPELDGRTYKVKWPGSPHAYYLTINDILLEGGKRRPFEIFINTQNTHDADLLSALTRMISAVFRRGGDVSFVAEELSQIVNPQGGAWVEGKYIPSLVGLIGVKLFEHMERIGFLEPREDDRKPNKKDGALCPSCHEMSVIFASGCEQCPCGWSSCG